jgi:large subunit ribosomal protein L25
MVKVNLKSNTRIETGKKVKSLRRENKIPAVLYGNKTKNHNLWVDYLEFQKIYNQAGESTILDLDIDSKKKANVLIHDVQRSPLTGKFSHVDFFEVRMDQKIETGVPIEFIGESEAVKSSGGVLVKSLDEIPVSCLPADLPAKIEVDIAKLKTFNDVIKISDLAIGDKIKIQLDPETVIANVAEPRSEAEIAGLSEKVEEDVTKVEGVVKEVPENETEKAGEKAKSE